MEINYLQLLFYSISVYVITYIIGHVLSSVIKIPKRYPFTIEFTKICLGFYSIICFYSIYRTNCITINVVLLLFGFLLFYWLYKNKYIHTKAEFYQSLINTHSIIYLSIQLIVLIIYYSVLFLKIKNPTSNVIYFVYGDFYVYPKIIEHLNRTGIEGIFADWYSGSMPIRSLYHFGELWYCAFFSNITQQTPFNVFYFDLFPICLTTYFLGACALIEIFIQPKNKIVYTFSISIFFICGISFYLLSIPLFTKDDWADLSLLFQPKYISSAIFIFYTLILSNKNKIIPLLYIGMATIIINIVVAPPIFIAFTLFILFLLMFNNIKYYDAFKYSIPLLITLVFISAYTLFINNENKSNTINNVFALPSFSLYYYLKTAFNCFAWQFIKSIISIFPFILLFLLSIKNKKLKLKNTIIIVVFLQISAILSYALFFNNTDAIQFWTNIYIPLSSIISFILLAHVINSKNLVLKMAAIVLVLLCFKQSKVLIKDNIINIVFVNELSKLYDGTNIVFFKTKDDYTKVFSKNINMYAPLPYLIMKYKSYNPICLSVFEIPMSSNYIDKKSELEIIKNAVFYKFVQLQKKNNSFVSVEQSQIDFIKKHKIKYAFTYLHSALPKKLQENVIYTIKDSINNITIYELKNIN